MATTLTAPRRIQLRRTRGYRKPSGAIVVARPSRWGNPIKVGTFGPEQGYPLTFTITPDEAVARFRLLAPSLDLEPLRGHDLACWCPLDQPCHADVLLELANAPGKETG